METRSRLRAERDLAVLRTGFHRSRARLERLARGSDPIVAGPFLSEVGFESLYWVPLLRWFVERYDVSPDRITAFSRGGAASWYEGVAGSYVDIFDHISPSELKDLQARRVGSTRNEKQLRLSRADIELIHAAGFPDSAEVLHPSVMYQLFWAVWASRRPVRRVLEHSRYEPFGDPGAERAKDILAELPADFIAFKPYFSGCFPDTQENRRFLKTLTARLAEAAPVVLLATGIDLDEHVDFSPSAGRIVSIAGLVEPADNLAVQTALVRRAGALITTYGGFAHLGPFLGVPTFAFYSDETFNHIHLDVMSRAVRDLRASGRAGFALAHVRELGLLEWLGTAVAPADSRM